MAASGSIDAIEWLRKQIEETAPDPLKTMLTTMVSALMSAEVDAVCGAGYGERHDDRANSRNGYRGETVGHAGRHHRPADPQAPARHVLPRLAA